MDVSLNFAVAGRAILFSEEKGDPLALYPSVLCDGRPYNRWLSERVLEAVLARWSNDSAMQSHGMEERGAAGGRVHGSEIAADVEWACAQSRLGFEVALPAASQLGDAAVLAVMGVALNLQRTVAVLGEFVIEDRTLTWPGPPIHLSRRLCGLIEYPACSPYFPGQIRMPVPVSRRCTMRQDIRHLGNALWCAPAEIEQTCEAAMALLREEAARLGIFR